MESEKFQSIQDFLLVYSYSVLSLSYDRQEQVRGIEPPSSAWKADILAIVRHLHVGLPSFGQPGNLGCLSIHSCVFLSRGVPRTGIEPVRCRQRGILSPLRLPVPPPGLIQFSKSGPSTCQVFRPNQPGGIRTPMKPSRIGFSTYLAVPCIPFPSLTRYFCFKVFRFFLTPLTFQHLYYITSFSICQALFSTFLFFLSNQSILKSILIDVIDYPICITHHYQEDFSLNQHIYYNSSIPLCQPFF